MTRTETFEKLNKIFCEVFNKDDIHLTDDTNAGNVEGWDSLAYITIISSVEDSFSIRLPMKNVLQLKKVGELVDMIIERID